MHSTIVSTSARACSTRRPACASRRAGLCRVATPEALIPAQDDRQRLANLANTQTALAPAGHPDRPVPHQQPEQAAQISNGSNGMACDAAIASTSAPAIAAGDLVVGRVVASGHKGSRVQLACGLVGWMPADQGPLAAAPGAQYRQQQHRGQQRGQQLLPVGHLRQFLVKNVPADMTATGQGPLLSAAEVDGRVAWARVRQVQEEFAQSRSNVHVRVEAVNSGGLVGSFLGLKAFVPYSHLLRRGSGPIDQAAAQKLVGTQLEAAIMEVDQERGKLTLSQKEAAINKAARQLQVGSLVSGYVREVTDRCVFVDLEGCSLRGLLHVSKISCARVRHPGDVFAPGDYVVAMVAEEVAAGKARVEISTAHLEAQAGDMLTQRGKVYDGAESQAAQVRAMMQQAALEAAQQGQGQ